MSESPKTAVIFGLANKRSIAWAIAQKLAAAGWQLAICYQNERLELEAKDLISGLPGAAGFMCDVTQDDQIARLFEELREKFGVLHGLVHSVG
ncbi:MAG: SDR family oxidoreductase, partial [Candidatus Acidiferrum sp.]